MVQIGGESLSVQCDIQPNECHKGVSTSFLEFQLLFWNFSLHLFAFFSFTCSTQTSSLRCHLGEYLKIFQLISVWKLFAVFQEWNMLSTMLGLTGGYCNDNQCPVELLIAVLLGNHSKLLP